MIETAFYDYNPQPRADGKYRFAIALDLDAEKLPDVLAILTSPEAAALEEAYLEFDYESRNGYGRLIGWRLATPDELAELESRAKRDADFRTKHERQELERIAKAHPDWLTDLKGNRAHSGSEETPATK